MKLSLKLTACAMAMAFVAIPFASTNTLPSFPTAEDSLMRITDKIDGDTSSSSFSPSVSVGNNVTSTKYPYSSFRSTIRKYQETNSDVMGWLMVPGTNMSQPIVFNPNQNNLYYLYRTWDGVNYPNTNYTNFTVTATYADYRSTFGDTWRSTNRNTVLYGHNWTNLREPVDVGANNSHVMFGQLPSYTNQQFAQQNPYIYFSTDKNEGIWKVFAVAYCEESNNFFYNNPRPSDDDYAKIISEWKQRTVFDFGVDVNTNDRILTLSTCTRQYSAGAQQRFVVVARLLRDGESENDPVTVKVNPNPKQPQF